MRQRGSDFDDFVVSAAPGLLRMSVALTGDRPAAEDLLQDVLERLYVAWPRIDDPPAYARRALANGSANRWRRRSRRPEHSVPDVPDVAVSDQSAAQSDRDAIRRAIATLPARQRAVVVLRYLEDLSEAETARILGCSVGTVKSQSARALTSLRHTVGTDTDIGSAERRR